MTVRLGPVSVRYSGDEQRAREHLPAAMQWLRITQERQRAGKVDTMRYARQLAEDAYCHVTLGGGMAILHIVAGAATLIGDGEIARDLVPDFVSGAIQNGYIEKEFPNLYGQQDKLARFKPTERCFWRYFREQGSDQWLRVGYSHVLRLAVEPHEDFSDALNNPNDNSPLVFSQYVRLKPTMYSGTMRKCVQALMGFGKQRKKPPNNQVETSLYEDAPKAGDQQVADVTADHAQSVRENGLQIRYDWRWSRTHGLTRAADGAWWLVEISKARGILAMMLPLHPSTTTPAFRDWLDNAGDTDALRLLDEFGGFPTGETFPDEVEPWIEAGKVLRLASPESLAGYYENGPYSEDIGWAFNLHGDEAHNCAWRYGDDDFQRGVHYACRISIGAAREWTDAPDLVGRLEALRGQEGYGDLDAVQWKCVLLSESQRRTARSATTAAHVYASVKGASVVPLAPGSAGVSQVSEGPLYHPGLIGHLVKFPDSTVGLLRSHAMKHRVFSHPANPPRCDTTVFVFFAGNELKWVKYFYDPRESPAQSWDDFEDCMYIGRWSQHSESGNRKMPFGLYSNDFDDRSEVAPGETDVSIEGRDMGYSDVIVADDIVRPYRGWITRRRRFHRKTTITSRSGTSIETGVAVPFHDREAYYYCTIRRSSVTRSQTENFQYLTDPWEGETWRNFPGFTGNWAGDIHTGHWVRLDPHPDGCGPVTARTVREPGAYYVSRTCADLADSGPWLSTCDNADSKVYSIPEPPLPPASFESSSEAYGEVWLVNSSSHGPIRTHSGDTGFGVWPLISPFNGDGNISADQYLATTQNALGDADTIRYSQNINSGTDIKGRPHWPEMESGGLTFIGVVDG